jgi:hypothetical protein
LGKKGGRKGGKREGEVKLVSQDEEEADEGEVKGKRYGRTKGRET